jgi:cell division septum initiation protein DivIVA
MTREELLDANARQERQIWKLRAQVAQAEKRVAQLQMINDRYILRIARLEAARDPKRQANAIFSK